MRLFNLVRTGQVAAVVVLWGVLSAASNGRGAGTVYAYRDRHDRWCAVADSKHFERFAGVESRFRFETDEVTVRYIGNKPAQIEDFMSNAEAEGSLLAKYTLDPSGNVRAARLVVREGEPMRNRNYDFAVDGKAYRPKAPAARAALKTYPAFSKVYSLSEFPFARMLSRAWEAARGAGPFCS